MARDRAVHTAPKPRGRRRGKVGAGAAFGVSSVLVGGLASLATAGTPARTVVFECKLASPTQTTSRFTIRNFPPDASLEAFVFIKSDDGTSVVYNGIPLTTDTVGSAASPSVLGPNPSTHNAVGAIAVFRDTNGNGRWDPNTDHNLFRSRSVTFPAGGCQNRMASPK